ncbi:MAG: AAA family ATPase [Kineosporiaceae bacterium]|jgi:pilus assembly protein CpaE
MTTICDLDPAVATALRNALGDGRLLFSVDELRLWLESSLGESTVVLGPTVDERTAYALADAMRITRPFLGVVLVRRYIDAGVLSEALRAGIREVVNERDVAGLSAAVHRSNDLADAMRFQAGTGQPDGTGPQGRVITIFSAKGGCGKTTLATNLAAALADRGRNEVCLVDLDLAFGDVAITLQLFPAHTIADAVPLANTLDLTAIQALLTPHSPGLTTLVAPVEPGNTESIPGSLVSGILELLRNHFDYVVVDTPPAFDDQVLAAFDLSDVVALIATLDIPALKNLKLTLETMDLLNYPRDRWRIVLNRADSKVGLSIAEVEKTLRTPITVQIPSSRDVPAAINRGVPIVLDDPRHPVSQSIRAFAERHVAAPTSAAGGPTRDRDARSDRRGFLHRRSRA